MNKKITLCLLLTACKSYAADQLSPAEESNEEMNAEYVELRGDQKPQSDEFEEHLSLEEQVKRLQRGWALTTRHFYEFVNAKSNALAALIALKEAKITELERKIAEGERNLALLLPDSLRHSSAIADLHATAARHAGDIDRFHVFLSTHHTKLSELQGRITQILEQQERLATNQRDILARLVRVENHVGRPYVDSVALYMSYQQ